MSINNNSYSTATAIQFGTSEMEGVWFNAQSMIIPSMSFSPPKIGGRFGTQINLPSDSVVYTDFTIDVLIDKEWKVYDLAYGYFLESLNVETGTFTDKKFDLWVDIRDGKGNVVKKFWLYNCRLTDFGEVNISTIDAQDELNVFTLTFTFDYMDYDNSFYKAKFDAPSE